MTWSATELSTWWDVVDVAFDAYAALYRDEPGFSVVHAGRRETADGDVEPEFAHRMAQLIEHEFDLESDGAELRFRLGVAIELGDALISRAFERDAAGDERYLAEAKRLVHDYLAEHLGRTRAARRRHLTTALALPRNGNGVWLEPVVPGDHPTRD